LGLYLWGDIELTERVKNWRGQDCGGEGVEGFDIGKRPWFELHVGGFAML